MHTDTDSLNSFRQSCSGKVIVPGDADYEQASTVLAGKGTPAVVVQVASPQDIMLALQYAQEHKLVVSVRSGGHSNAGFGTNDGGLVIDVGYLNEVKLVDAATNRVRVGAGARWGDIAQALHEYGLGISSGDTRTVGVAGLTLGAGIGWMVREYGLAIDSLLSADIVTASGELLTASTEANSDLFWAICGGGGNFGVVVSFEFTAHPVGDVYFGPITFAADDTQAILKGWRDYMRRAPERLTTIAILFPANASGGQNPAMCILQCCWDGADQAEANAALKPLRALGNVLDDKVAQKPYYQVLGDAHMPPNVHAEVGNAFFKECSDKLIAAVVAAQQNGALFQLRSISGAMNRVSADATAFAHRDSEVLVVAPRFFPLGTPEAQIQAGLQPWRDIMADASGAYSNFFSRGTSAEVDLAYPPATLKRLAKIKAKYDPQNIFNQNLNIKPAS